MNSPRHNPTPLARMVHLLLLLGLLFSTHGIAPAICLAAAVIDGDHAVKVGVSKDGAMTVVLSHAGKSAAELTYHEHDVLCRVLVAFAEAPATDASDHVLAFKAVDEASRALRLVLSVPGIPKAPPVSLVGSFCSIKTPSVHSAGRQVQSYVWSQGLALKSGRTVMRC